MKGGNCLYDLDIGDKISALGFHSQVAGVDPR